MLMWYAPRSAVARLATPSALGAVTTVLCAMLLSSYLNASWWDLSEVSVTPTKIITLVDYDGHLDVNLEKSSFDLHGHEHGGFSFAVCVFFKHKDNKVVYVAMAQKGMSDPTALELGLDTLALNELFNQMIKTPVGKYVPNLEVSVKPKRIINILYGDEHIDLREVVTGEGQGFSLTVKWELYTALDGKIQMAPAKPVLVTEELKKDPRLANHGGFRVVKNDQTIEGSITVYQVKDKYRIGVNVAGKTACSQWVKGKSGKAVNPFHPEGTVEAVVWEKRGKGYVKSIWHDMNER